MNEIFKAVFNRLVDQLDIDVFDHVPQNYNSFPYVRIDPLATSNSDTELELGFDSTVQIIVFSDYKGSKEVADENYNIYQALHRYAMPDTASFCITTIQQEFSTVVLESDGITRQSIQRFRILFEDLPV